MSDDEDFDEILQDDDEDEAEDEEEEPPSPPKVRQGMEVALLERGNAPIRWCIVRLKQRSNRV